MFLVLSAAAALAAPPLTTHWVGIDVAFGVRAGEPAQVTGADPEAGYLVVTIGRDDGLPSCEITFSSLTAAMVATDDPAWRALWPGAAWSLTLGEPAYHGMCGDLGEPWSATVPGDTFAAAGWRIGLGPEHTFRPAGGAPGAVGKATVYAWMDGARPYPLGTATVTALTPDGALTGDLLDVGGATTLPDAWFEVVGAGLML